MSVEKLSDSSKVYSEGTPYTQVLNDIIEHIKDNDAFRIYAYSLSKSRDWNVVKEWTAKICGVGEKKSREVWSYLHRCGLIEYVIHRDEKGKIIKTDIRVLNGTKFNKDVQFLNKKPIGVKTAPVDSIQRGKNPLSGQTTRAVFAPLLNKDITNKEKALPNKEKSFYKDVQKKSRSEWREENDKIHDFAESMDQMANERKAIQKHEEIKKMEMGSSSSSKNWSTKETAHRHIVDIMSKLKGVTSHGSEKRRGEKERYRSLGENDRAI